jgi:4-hydroxyproline epimerase
VDFDMKQLEFIDSHTGGEPTRLIIGGGPALRGTVAEQLAQLRSEHDWLRKCAVNEPRGSDVLVGALLCTPSDPSCAAGVIFFNNVGYLGMCGHGTIGLIASLAHLGRIGPGVHRIETPVGVVAATLRADGKVEVRNVPSYRHARHVTVDVPGIGPVAGDVAWGGNWFFLVHEHGQELSMTRIDALTDYAWRVRQALSDAGVTGANGAEVDHIELYGPSATADSKCFVLCPGRAYDRSPCGTGTSAKLACLAADGVLAPGRVWRQESIVGSVFEGRIEIDGDGARVTPTIVGEAWVSAAGQLLLDERDPFRFGI